MKDRAYAKINLALDVFNVREDGYHDIKSIMVPISFYDEVEITTSFIDEFECNRRYIKYNEQNSIYKMIAAVKEKYGIDKHHHIILNKWIPTQAGLGGGTSDAAAALRIMKNLYDLDLSADDERELCVKVGADVLFNYYNKPAVVEGIGDIVTPFEIAKRYYTILIKPFKGVSTRESYATLDMNICDHPDIDRLRLALETGDSIEGLLGNSLEQPALILNEDVKIIKDKMIEAGARNVLMSGSGSTVYAISDNEEEIVLLNEKLRPLGSRYFIRLAKTLQSAW